jgi:hypothetical protein
MEADEPPRFVSADLFRLDPRFARFLSIEAEGDCWLWQGGTQAAGRNKAHRRGRIHRPRSGHHGPKLYVYKWVYILFWGAVPEGHDVHHTCYNRQCCNPNHLTSMEIGPHRRMHGYPQ